MTRECSMFGLCFLETTDFTLQNLQQMNLRNLLQLIPAQVLNLIKRTVLQETTGCLLQQPTWISFLFLYFFNWLWSTNCSTSSSVNLVFLPFVYYGLRPIYTKNDKSENSYNNIMSIINIHCSFVVFEYSRSLIINVFVIHQVATASLLYSDISWLVCQDKTENGGDISVELFLRFTLLHSFSKSKLECLIVNISLNTKL